MSLLFVHSNMASKTVTHCCLKLLEKGMNISFAESASTGRLVYEFTSVPECGAVVKGSIVCYDRSVKEDLFKIPAKIIDTYSAESVEVTQLLAESLRTLMPADIMVAVTGLAAPGGSETADKPVGTMFIHGYFKEEPFSSRQVFDGNPDEIIMKTTDAVAAILLRKLS